MTGALLWLLVAAGVGVLATRRRRIAVGLVSAQAVLLALVVALEAYGSTGHLVAAASLLVRAIVLGALLLVVVLRTHEARPVRSGTAPLARAAAGVGLATALAVLMPSFGLESREAEVGSLALIAFGLVAVASRSGALHQVAGFVLIENGIALAATAIPGGGDVVIELGAALDLIVVALVAVALHARIVEAFGVADTRLLRELRD